MHSGITKVISKALYGVSLPGHRASDEHMVSHTQKQEMEVGDLCLGQWKKWRQTKTYSQKLESSNVLFCKMFSGLVFSLWYVCMWQRYQWVSLCIFPVVFIIGPILGWACGHTEYRPYFPVSFARCLSSPRTKFWPMGYERKWCPQVLGDRGHFLFLLPIQHCDIGPMASAPSWTRRMRTRSLSRWNRKLEAPMAQMILEPSPKPWTAHTQTFHERNMHSMPFYHV